jgi:hypothetical protein
MVPNPSDQDRFRRIRDEQLTSRDPMKKQHKLDRTIAERHRRAREPFSLGKIWAGIPHRWRGLLYGGLGGIAVMIGLPEVWASVWADACGIVVLPFGMLLGFVIGRAVDTREELRDLTR